MYNIWFRVLAYTGVDLSEQAMQIGEQNVRPMLPPDAQLSFVVNDMLSFVRKAESALYDLVFASLAVHHLQDTEKEQLVCEIRRILKANGAFILVDIFLQEDKDRDNFMREIEAHVRCDWVKLTIEQIDNILKHTFNFDFPAKLAAFERWAKQNSTYADVICLQSLRFSRTIVLEA